MLRNAPSQDHATFEMGTRGGQISPPLILEKITLIMVKKYVR